MIAIFPGSFDPLTKAHEDIVKRASAIFDELIFALLCNPRKTPLIPKEAKLEMMRKVAMPCPNVRVCAFSGLLAELARQEGAGVILRGLRSESELGAEMPAAILNRQLYSGAETLFIPTDPSFSAYSSSVVKEIARFGGNYRPLLPDCIADDIVPYLNQ